MPIVVVEWSYRMEAEKEAEMPPIPDIATAKRMARAMLSHPKFQVLLADRQPNGYEPHDRELANTQLPGRIDAVEACLFGKN